MLSQTTEYALRAIVVLSEKPGVSYTAETISARAQVPQDYLVKVLQPLVRNKLVATRRGRGGGFSLARPASAIRVLDVVSAVDPLRRIHSCPLGIASHGITLCPLHRKLDDAIRLVEEAFASTTIADVLSSPSPVRPLDPGGLCHVSAPL